MPPPESAALPPRSGAAPATDAPVVAFDVGPLHGPRTGVGNAAAWTYDALAGRADVVLRPYLTSLRATTTAGTRRLPLPATLALRWWPHWSPPYDRVLGRPDVVHGTNYVVPPARCARLVSVYDCWFLEHPDDVAPDVRRAGDVLRRAVADGATVVTSSKATAGRVRELLSTDRVRAIALGPPPPPGPVVPGRSSTDEAGADQPYILAIGTVERRKNYPVLIKAFGRLCAEHPTARLVIAGRGGDDSVAVERALWQIGHEAAERITLLGEVDAATKTRLLAGATALAYPSLDEGFGFPILEAAQLGVPVVASAAGSIPEVAANAALLAPATDADALAANLHWVLTDEGIRRKLIARGTRNLSRFSWERCATELTALYRDLAEARR